MDKYWQVALTYLRRPRFLIAGSVYLATSWWWVPALDSDLRVLSSAEMACILACFIALHARRQFGTPGRGVVPGFAVPHLVVAALASAFVWIAVPWIQAELSVARPWNAIAVHSIAGLFLALVVIWPKAIAILAASPVVIVWAWSLSLTTKSSFFLRLIEGNEPNWSAALVVLAVLAHPLAAIVLLRLGEQGTAANDDFSIETIRSDRPLGRWDRLMLVSRDASVERRLAGVGHRWWAVERWRIPVAVSWSQLALVTLCVAIMMAVAAWFRGGAAALVAVWMATAVMLIMPFGPWNARRHALAIELMRPVARLHYFRELAAALALDVCLWTGLASAISVFAVILAVRPEPGISRWGAIAVYLTVLWGMAVWLYGVALVTLRLRYWIPLIVTLGIVWSLGTWSIFIWRASTVHHTPMTLATPFEWSLFSAAAGLLLAWSAYRRWLEMDWA